MTMLRYIKEGKIKVDKTKNSERVTFHDSCNNARSCGFYEEPRELLEPGDHRLPGDVPQPRRRTSAAPAAAARCRCPSTRRGGWSRPRSRPSRSRPPGAKIVVTSCHNCVDGLTDLIKHYELDCEVKQLVDLVAEALVLEECAGEEEPAEEPVAEAGHRGAAAARRRSAGSHDPGRRRRGGRPDLPHHGPRGRRRRGPRGDRRRRGDRGRQAEKPGPHHPRPLDARQGRRRGVRRAAQRPRDSRTSRSASSPATRSSAR